MYAIDKEKLGSFIAQLRKEKGMTQKELAARLYISDKAVSKWETGVSIPDTALLVPLAQVLEVTTAELLMYQRLENTRSLDSQQVDSIVQTAIAYPAEGSPAVRSRKWAWIYGISMVVALACAAAHGFGGTLTDSVTVTLVLGGIFGAYFCFFAQTKLPDYYDQNKIYGMHQGAIRMNIPGLRFSNRNWPWIVLVGKIWSCAALVIFPALSLLMHRWVPQIWVSIERYVLLVLELGGLFVPIWIVGKKYE